MPPGTSLPDTLAILQAELAPVRVASLGDMPPDSGRTRVVIGIDSCTVDPPGARITVWTDNVPRVRSVSLSDIGPDARDRTLALALAEATRDFAFPDLRAKALPADAPAANDVATPEPIPAIRRKESTTPMEEAPPHDGAPVSAVPRALGLFRFVAAPATLLGGAEIGIAWRRVSVSVAGLATGRSTSLGDATLYTLFASPSFDVVDFGARTALRITGELGIAGGNGSAIAPATGSSATSLHAAASAGMATVLRFGDGWVFEGTLSAGYASSLTLRAEGSELIGLNGFFAGASAGVRLPWRL